MRLTFDQVDSLYDQTIYEGYIEVVQLENKAIAVERYTSNYDKVDRIIIEVDGEIKYE